MMAVLLFLVLLGLAILLNSSSHAENGFGSCSSEVEFTIEQSKQHYEPIYILYCKSRKKSFDDSAEFQVDGFSREHILVINGRCFDRKKQECSFEYCSCDPLLNGFTVKFKMDNLKVGQTFGCMVRLRNDATGTILKHQTSNKFNGTDFIPDECNVKVIGTKTDITSITSNSSRPTDDIENHSDSGITTTLLITLITAGTILLILFLVKWCQRSKTEGSPKPNELVTLLPTPEHTQTLFEKLMEKLLECIEIKDAVKYKKQSKEELHGKMKALEMEFTTLKQEEESTHTTVLSRGLNALQMELTAISQEYEQAFSTELKADDFFTINCKSDIIDFLYFQENPELQHELMFRNERVLDMCFVEQQNKLYLVYIDADNKKIVRQNIIPGKDRKEGLLKKQPNRLSKINNETVAVIYKKGIEVLIFNVKTMKEEKTCKMSEQNILESHNGIQGILALSENNFILSDKIHLCVLRLKENKPIVKKLVLENKVEFDTARRLTHAITSDGKKDIIFIADENDKTITSIAIPCQDEENDSIAEYTITQIKEHNRGLQNVRAIVATQSRIYAATSAGISVFCHNRGQFANCFSQSEFGQNSKDYKMLVEYKKHVEHTRGLCLYNFGNYIHIALSCVINHKDVILVFKLKPNSVFK